MYNKFLSHPTKPYINHIGNMIDEKDSDLEKSVKLFHDIAKLKNNFQIYIRDTTKGGKDKNHSLLSAYFFILNNNFENRDMLFGFLSIVSHHGNIENFFELSQDKYLGKYFINSKEFNFFDEVVSNAQTLNFYKNIEQDIKKLETKAKDYQRYLRRFKFKDSFKYQDFVDFKKLYASLIYSDKYEAIFSLTKEKKEIIENTILDNYISNFEHNKRRDDFRKHVIDNFNDKHRLFTLTAPTGYGKTITALQFALKFKKEKVIFALPFTSIIDQTKLTISTIFKNSDIDIFKIHHKTTIDEGIDEDRYSKVKFLMSSFSGNINITTLYQIIFAIFGNKNKDNIKFNQFKNSVVIIDEAQAIPYAFRKDFIKICELISQTMETVFIFMSATMPIMSDNFIEISNLDYFKNQNRYILKWLNLENGQDSLIEKVKFEASIKHTLCVVNTIKKAQELYQNLKDQFECYCLNGYMTDHDKKHTIKIISQRLEQNDTKILLISTQSIEAGIDLDFEVGFREVSPISSIIQTAGRVNRHFGEKKGILYIFDDICEYSDLIYGDLQLISKTIFEIFKEKDIYESEILEVSKRYFEKINIQLERYLIEEEIKKLEFFNINKKIENIMDNNNFKELIIIEPYNGFIKEIEKELLMLKQLKIDKFKQKDLTQGVVKKLLQFGVNVSKRDIENFQTSIETVKYLFSMLYLPYGASEYDESYGIKKFQLEITEGDLFD